MIMTGRIPAALHNRTASFASGRAASIIAHQAEERTSFLERRGIESIRDAHHVARGESQNAQGVARHGVVSLQDVPAVRFRPAAGPPLRLGWNCRGLTPHRVRPSDRRRETLPTSHLGGRSPSTYELSRTEPRQYAEGLPLAQDSTARPFPQERRVRPPWDRPPAPKP